MVPFLHFLFQFFFLFLFFVLDSIFFKDNITYDDHVALEVPLSRFEDTSLDAENNAHKEVYVFDDEVGCSVPASSRPVRNCFLRIVLSPGGFVLCSRLA